MGTNSGYPKGSEAGQAPIATTDVLADNATLAGSPSGRRRFTRRIVIVVVVVAQLSAIVMAYDSDYKTFGFQMFPESSRWQAEIVRVGADGSETPVNQDWPYRWADLVQGRGLDNPFVEHHADSGLRNQLGLLQGALDWVAHNTPADTTTAYLEARVIYRDNGRGPFTTVLRSVEREVRAP